MIKLNDIRIEEKKSSDGREYSIATVDFSIGDAQFIFDGLFVQTTPEGILNENLAQQIAKRLAALIIRDLVKIDNLGK